MDRKELKKTGKVVRVYLTVENREKLKAYKDLNKLVNLDTAVNEIIGKTVNKGGELRK